MGWLVLSAGFRIRTAWLLLAVLCACAGAVLCANPSLRSFSPNRRRARARAACALRAPALWCGAGPAWPTLLTPFLLITKLRSRRTLRYD